MVLLAIGTLVYMLLFTRGFVGLHSDSVAYLSAAENIVAGRGLVIYRLFENATPLSSFPFLYPILLSPFRSIPLFGVFLLNSLSFFIFSYSLIYILKLLLKDSSKLKSTILYVLVIVGAPILNAYTMALTEPLFLAAVFFLLRLILEGKLEGKRLVVVVLLSSLLPLLRYAGVFVWLFVGGILLVQADSLKFKLKYIALYSLSCAPLLLWFIYLRSLGAESRQLVSEPLTFDFLVVAAKTMWMWVFPTGMLGLGVGGVFLVAVAYYTYFNLKNHNRVPIVLIWFFASYILFIIASYAFFDRAIASDFQRILTPLFPIVVMLVGAALFSIRNIGAKRVGILIFSVMVMLIHIAAGSKLIQYGPPLSYRIWQKSDLVSYVKENRETFHFISNAWEPLYVYANVYVDRIPVKGQEQRDKNVEYFERALHKDRPLVFVFAKNHPKVNYLSNPESLGEFYDLTLLKEFSEGSVYQIRVKRDTP